ncbi:MAG: hypothetical protein KZQ76_00930 [Candidatus Thiodiazotropha sp. (ex Epidulcina cf. delphinae)]|nr:hypothetical protein [Candidatus Thiodiazotropha sp. (ex Epidulcina cf. delphinae)]
MAQPKLFAPDDAALSLGVSSITDSRSAYELRIAHDGFEAGRLLQEFRQQILLPDLMSPRMDFSAVAGNPEA